ncbi:hypothetical protein F5Y10DRAFT_276900 [Nemania abortiva]|nr:hypothetical protein F5Y10DRAFT_276900 [Nemania abortiva]
MLVLVAGITGMCGQACARAAFNAGHDVRGLARNRSKLSSDVADRLEGFVAMKDIYDIAALDQSVQGVDAIIAAVHYTPAPLVDGQILLLRAAERAGVKIFHAASWNYDWSRVALGDCESYDNYITFRNHARLSSTIRPLFAFTGVIIEFLFDVLPHSNPIDEEAKTLSYFGTGNEGWIFTALEDLAAYTIQAISEPNAAQGGFYYVDSFRCTTRELGQMYEQVYKTQLESKQLGTVEDLERTVQQYRETIGPLRHREYAGWVYLMLQLKGLVDYESVDSRRWSHIKRTGLSQWLEKRRQRLMRSGSSRSE